MATNTLRIEIHRDGEDSPWFHVEGESTLLASQNETIVSGPDAEQLAKDNNLTVKQLLDPLYIIPGLTVLRYWQEKSMGALRLEVVMARGICFLQSAWRLFSQRGWE